MLFKDEDGTFCEFICDCYCQDTGVEKVVYKQIWPFGDKAWSLDSERFYTSNVTLTSAAELESAKREPLASVKRRLAALKTIPVCEAAGCHSV